jgi:hypothetical protein
MKITVFVERKCNIASQATEQSKCRCLLIINEHRADFNKSQTTNRIQ